MLKSATDSLKFGVYVSLDARHPSIGYYFYTVIGKYDFLLQNLCKMKLFRFRGFFFFLKIFLGAAEILLVVTMFTTISQLQQQQESNGTTASFISSTSDPTVINQYPLYNSTCSDAATLKATNNQSPIIFNYTKTAKPNDIITLQGANFGPNPTITIRVVQSDMTAQQIMSSADRITLPIKNKILDENRSTNFLAAVIPRQMPIGLYAIFVQNDSGQSAPVFINRSSPTQYEFSEVSAQYTFRIFGRNMQLGTEAPTATFIPTDESSLKLPATVENIDQYTVKVTAPGLVPGKQYFVYTNNGYGGCWGDNTIVKGFSATPIPLTAKAGGGDPFHLNVAWASDFASFGNNIYNVKTDPRLSLHAVGDGTTDDQPAIQNAIDKAANASGGVVYLPQGTYRLKTAIQLYDDASTEYANLALKSHVVLQGDGQSQSVLTYGYPEDYVPDRKVVAAVVFGDIEAIKHNYLPVSVGGIMNLGLHNYNQSLDQQSGSLVAFQNTSEFFVKNINITDDIHLPDTPNAEHSTPAYRSFGTTNALLEDSTFAIGARGSHPYHFANSSYVRIKNNHMTYLRSRATVMNSDNIIVENNTFTKNGDLLFPDGDTIAGIGDNGGPEIDNVHNVVLSKNTINRIGQELPRGGTGEAMLFQGCIGRTVLNETPSYFADLGTASSATALSLTDNSKNWSTFAENNPHYFVAIVAGKGTGQYRNISANTATSITIDQPWEVIPDETSKYVINESNADNALLLSNKVKGLPIGITIYCGGNNIVLDSNTVNETFIGIYIRSDQRLYGPYVPGPDNTPQIDPNIWYGKYNLTNDIFIQDNTVATTESARLNESSKRSNTAAIWIEDASVFSDYLHGIGTLGVTVKNNNLSYPDDSEPAYSPIFKNGYIATNDWKPIPENGKYIYPTITTPAILGTVFQDNQVHIREKTNPPLSAIYFFNTGTDGTIVRDSLTKLQYVRKFTVKSPSGTYENGPQNTQLLNNNNHLCTSLPTSFLFPSPQVTGSTGSSLAIQSLTICEVSVEELVRLMELVYPTPMQFTSIFSGLYCVLWDFASPSENSCWGQDFPFTDPDLA